VISLAADFNEATCGIYGTTFLPFVLAAQKQTNVLSQGALANTSRYIAWCKTTFEAEQKKVSRKVLRQLALLGQLSEPEQRYNNRIYYYQNVQKRQQKLHVPMVFAQDRSFLLSFVFAGVLTNRHVCFYVCFVRGPKIP